MRTMKTRGSASELVARMEEFRERQAAERERERIRAEVLADLLRGGTTVLGQRVALTWPDGLPASMSEEAILHVLERAAGQR